MSKFHYTISDSFWHMPDLIQLAIPAFLVLLIVEVVCDAVMRRELYEVKDTAASLTMGIGNVLIGIATRAVDGHSPLDINGCYESGEKG